MNDEIKAVESASNIQMINVWVAELDIDFLKKCLETLKEQAIRQDSLIILNPGYNQIKTKILDKKNQALEHLINYTEALNEVEELKIKLGKSEALQEKINDLFL